MVFSHWEQDQPSEQASQFTACHDQRLWEHPEEEYPRRGRRGQSFNPSRRRGMRVGYTALLKAQAYAGFAQQPVKQTQKNGQATYVSS